MPDKFILHSNYKPTGDQPQAIEKLSEGIKNGLKEQVLLGVTDGGNGQLVRTDNTRRGNVQNRRDLG